MLARVVYIFALFLAPLYKLLFKLRGRQDFGVGMLVCVVFGFENGFENQ